MNTSKPVPGKESMDEYAKKRNKKESKIVGVTIRKAHGGYIVNVDTESYDGRPEPSVYNDLAGVMKCVKEKLG